MTDCRCTICGCCKHDHRGWTHDWTSAEPKWLGFKCPASISGMCLNMVEGSGPCDDGECWRAHD